MSLGGLMYQTMTVQAPTKTADSVGGRKEDWTDVVTGAACRVCQLSKADEVMYGRLGFRSTHRVYCEENALITDKCRLVVETKTYVIVGVMAARGMSGVHHYEVLVRLKE